MEHYDCPSICDIVTSCQDCQRYADDCDKELKLEDVYEIYTNEETKDTIYEVKKK